ncbi:cellulose binding domain-containing protein [Actinoallomurus rhizosphaericola]|uniref:cellulose binding domain-containing protein n=1 Tax=Actinoallomurus rhizosphaericola TaxID=2952536 RepID=UPI002091DD56|nr:cellulose binding domain-containing protein [Actinoallomurus rhizosphaericola]MCO5992104.1 cellulose-binding domain-containing protein [Actinoallomurus rhizosphaericola]
MPLLPTVAGVLAIGAIVSAVSTQQISLNFAGGTPSGGASPIVTVSGGPEHSSGRRTARNDASQSGRVSRGAARSGVAVTVRTTSASARGFQGEARIVNQGATAVRGWTLVLRYAHARITAVTGGTAVRTGTVLIVRNPAARPAIAAGRSVTVRFTATGTGTAPSGCTLNGSSCRP